MSVDFPNPEAKAPLSSSQKGLAVLAVLAVLALLFIGSTLSRKPGTSQSPEGSTPKQLDGVYCETGQLVVALEIGYEKARLSFIKATEVRFQPQRLRENDGVFQIRLQKKGEAPRQVEFKVHGLIDPKLAELCDENGDLRLGDEIFSRTIGTLVKLPALAPPFELRVLNPEGAELLRSEILPR